MEEEFNYEHVSQLVKKQPSKEDAIRYLNKFIVKTDYGIFHKSSPKERWTPVNRNHLKMCCNNDAKLFTQWMGQDNTNDVKIVMDATNKDTLDENGYYTTINVWCGFQVEPTTLSNDELTAKVKPWLNHLKECWCNNDESIYSMMLKHFASIFQHPETRSEKNIVLKTTYQSPISTNCIDAILKPIEKILGHHYSTLQPNRNVILINTDNFNWTQTLILVLQGPISRPKNLLDVIEKDQISVKYKGHKPFHIKNLINVFIIDNDYNFQLNHQTVTLRINDARYQHENQNKDYFDGILNTTPDVLLQYLLNFKY